MIFITYKTNYAEKAANQILRFTLSLISDTDLSMATRFCLRILKTNKSIRPVVVSSLVRLFRSVSLLHIHIECG